MKKAFSLILAIIFILAIASIGALSFSISSAGAQSTTKQYMHEQAELLSQGAIEYAILRIQQTDFAAAGKCINKITTNLKPTNPTGAEAKITFISTLRITYIGDENLLKSAGCSSIIKDTTANKQKIKAVIIRGRTCSTTNGADCDEEVAHSFSTTQIP